MEVMVPVGSILLLLISTCAFAQQRPLLSVPITHAAVMGDPRVLFAAAPAGLFRSTDDGANWRALALKPAGERQPSIHRLIPHPTEPRTLFATTDAGDGGLFKTSDNGDTWVAMNKGLPLSGGVLEQLFLPNSPGFNLMYARIGNDLFKSSDGGQNWALQGRVPPSNGPPGTLEVNQRDPSLMFWAFGTGIFRSIDEGVNWTLLLSQRIPVGTGVISMAMDPFRDNISYVGVATLDSPAFENGGFYIGTNGRESSEAGLALITGELRPLYLYSTRTQPQRLYSTEPPSRCQNRTCIARSIDRVSEGGLALGRQWSLHTVTNAPGIALLGIHPQNPDWMIAALRGGISTSVDGGTSWQPRPGFVSPTLTSVPSVEFRLPPGGNGRLDVPVRVVESSDWVLQVNSTISGAPWLSVTGASGSTPLNAGIRVSAENLEPGTYTASIRFNSPNAINDGLTLPIRLIVAPRPEPKVTYVSATYAGTGQPGNFGDNGLATRAIIGVPDSLALDPAGNLYLSLPSSQVIRTIATNGRITRFAGNAQIGLAGDGGQALLASFATPRGLAHTPAGLFVADSDNQRIRQITPDGGNIATVAEIDRPRGLAIDAAGNYYVAIPTLHVVARITPDRRISVFAGSPRQSGFRGDGGLAAGSLLSGPQDVAIGPDGTVYIADTENHRIRAVSRDGRIRTVAGVGLPGFFGDSPDATLSALNRPAGVTVDSTGTVFFSDTDNHLVRMIPPDGSIETIAGTGTPGFGGDDGPALSASYRQPADLIAAPNGVLYIADSQNMRVRTLTPRVRATGPSISEGGVVSLADRSSRLSPGSLFIVSGINFADGEASAMEASWPLSLGGVTVTFGGKPAALSFVSPNQINGQIPWDAETGLVDVVVTVNETASRPSAVNLAAHSPAILAGAGNRALAVNEDGNTNAPSAPAPLGSLVTIYLSGVGPLTEALETGAAAPEDPAAVPAELPIITVNRDTVEPLEYRMVPGRVGLAQVQFRVPLLAAGDHPVRVTIGGASSASPVISVR